MENFKQILDANVSRKVENILSNYEGGLVNAPRLVEFTFGIDFNPERLAWQADVFSRIISSKNLYFRRLFNSRDNEHAKESLFKIYVFSYAKAVITAMYFTSIPEGVDPSYVLHGHAVLFRLMIKESFVSTIPTVTVAKNLRMSAREKDELVEQLTSHFPFLKDGLSKGFNNNWTIQDADMDRMIIGLVNYMERSSNDVREVRPKNNNSNRNTNNSASTAVTTTATDSDSSNPETTSSNPAPARPNGNNGNRTSNNQNRRSSDKLNGEVYLFVDMFDSKQTAQSLTEGNLPLGNAFIDFSNSMWYYAFNETKEISHVSYSFCKACFITLKEVRNSLPEPFSDSTTHYFEKLPIMLDYLDVDRTIKYEVRSIAQVKPQYNPEKNSRSMSSVYDSDPGSSEWVGRPRTPIDGGFTLRRSESPDSPRRPDNQSDPDRDDRSSGVSAPKVVENVKTSRLVEGEITNDKEYTNRSFESLSDKMTELRTYASKPGESSTNIEFNFEKISDRQYSELLNLFEINLNSELDLKLLDKDIVRGTSIFREVFPYYISSKYRIAFAFEDRIGITWDKSVQIPLNFLFSLLSKCILIYLGIVTEETVLEYLEVEINGIKVTYRFFSETRRYVRLIIIPVLATELGLGFGVGKLLGNRGKTS